MLTTKQLVKDNYKEANQSIFTTIASCLLSHRNIPIKFKIYVLYRNDSLNQNCALKKPLLTIIPLNYYLHLCYFLYYISSDLKYIIKSNQVIGTKHVQVLYQ